MLRSICTKTGEVDSMELFCYGWKLACKLFLRNKCCLLVSTSSMCFEILNVIFLFVKFV